MKINTFGPAQKINSIINFILVSERNYNEKVLNFFCKSIKERTITTQTNISWCLFTLAFSEKVMGNWIIWHKRECFVNAWLFLSLGLFFRFLQVPSDSFRFLQIPSGSFRFLQIPSGSFRFLQVPSDSFRFLQILSGSFRFLQESGSFRFLQVPSGSFQFVLRLHITKVNTLVINRHI